MRLLSFPCVVPTLDLGFYMDCSNLSAVCVCDHPESIGWVWEMPFVLEVTLLAGIWWDISK